MAVLVWRKFPTPRSHPWEWAEQKRLPQSGGRGGGNMLPIGGGVHPGNRGEFSASRVGNNPPPLPPLAPPPPPHSLLMPFSGIPLWWGLKIVWGHGWGHRLIGRKRNIPSRLQARLPRHPCSWICGRESIFLAVLLSSPPCSLRLGHPHPLGTCQLFPPRLTFRPSL